MVERPHQVREVMGLILCRVIPKTLKMVAMNALMLRIAGLALRLTGWCQDKLTSSTVKLTLERPDVVQNIV